MAFSKIALLLILTVIFFTLVSSNPVPYRKPTVCQSAVCLCTALKADLLGLKLNVPISLSVILNKCGKKVPSGFKCA
ncbi:hypothetical protein HID58_076329 [Brassica napus]|uniref:Hydrophobic seed protein domain-containing protein n=1 Tax=Brassica napus TaxID=3708 RepID=A0ABQ7YNW8_BRANA|nr:hypothetical protein HID58_076329 [Brassica napus]